MSRAHSKSSHFLKIEYYLTRTYFCNAITNMTPNNTEFSAHERMHAHTLYCIFYILDLRF